MKRIIHRHHAGAIFVGELHAAFHRRERGGLAKFAIGIPAFDGFELGWNFFDICARFAPAGLGTEKLIEVQRLDGIVRFNAVPGGEFGKTCTGIGLLGGVTALAIRRSDKIVVKLNGHDVNAGHNRSQVFRVILIIGGLLPTFMPLMPAAAAGHNRDLWPALFGPVRVEKLAARGVDAFVSVGTEIIALTLQQVRR